MVRSPMFGEFMGTLVMLLLGDGVVAGVLLKRTKAENSGWMVITTAWCFAVLAGIFTANLCGSSDAHLNPTITLAFPSKTTASTSCCPMRSRSSPAVLLARSWYGCTTNLTGLPPRTPRLSWGSSAPFPPFATCFGIPSRRSSRPLCSSWWLGRSARSWCSRPVPLRVLVLISSAA